MGKVQLYNEYSKYMGGAPTVLGILPINWQTPNTFGILPIHWEYSINIHVVLWIAELSENPGTLCCRTFHGHRGLRGG
jgi:hypothetical protein